MSCGASCVICVISNDENLVARIRDVIAKEGYQLQEFSPYDFFYWELAELVLDVAPCCIIVDDKASCLGNGLFLAPALADMLGGDLETPVGLAGDRDNPQRSPLPYAHTGFQSDANVEKALRELVESLRAQVESYVAPAMP